MVKRFTKSVLEKSKFHAAWHRFPRKPHTKMITRNYSLTPWNPLQFLNYWGAPFCFTLACLARAWGLCSTTICAFRAGGGLGQTAYTIGNIPPPMRRLTFPVPANHMHMHTDFPSNVTILSIPLTSYIVKAARNCINYINSINSQMLKVARTCGKIVIFR